MSQTSIFDLLQVSDTPQAKELQLWVSAMFPKTNEQASFSLAVQLEKLFEMAIYENQIDTVHLLLQQGIPPNIQSDWGTTPLMWATCLGYNQIEDLLISYGADQHLESFSGKVASDFKKNTTKNLPEYTFIVNRQNMIREQIKAGYLKRFGSTSSSTSGTHNQNTTPKRQRQIDNGKGIDEVFKKMKTTSRSSRTISLIIT